MDDILLAARRAAQAAGELIRERFPRPGDERDFEVQHKGRINLVTEVDVAAEQRIREILLEAFPNHGVLGEEEGQSGQSEHLWVVDPLDGTRSFAHGFPYVAVSIAYERAGQVEVGVVYDPLRDELFEARRGGGARLNGQPIRVSTVSCLEHGLLASGFPYQLAEFDNTDFFALLRQLIVHSGGFRRCGAASLDFCSLACGRLDGYWEFFLQPWDAAAGALLVEEAGGRVTDLEGRPFRHRHPEMLCSNGHLHDEIIRLAAPYLAGIRPHL